MESMGFGIAVFWGLMLFIYVFCLFVDFFQKCFSKKKEKKKNLSITDGWKRRNNGYINK